MENQLSIKNMKTLNERISNMKYKNDVLSWLGKINNEYCTNVLHYQKNIDTFLNAYEAQRADEKIIKILLNFYSYRRDIATDIMNKTILLTSDYKQGIINDKQLRTKVYRQYLRANMVKKMRTISKQISSHLVYHNQRLYNRTKNKGSSEIKRLEKVCLLDDFSKKYAEDVALKDLKDLLKVLESLKNEN